MSNTIAFDAEFTKDEFLEMGSAERWRNQGVRFRIALAVLSKTAAELQEMAESDPDTFASMAEEISEGAKTIKGPVEALEAAENRMFATAHNLGWIEIPEK